MKEIPQLSTRDELELPGDGGNCSVTNRDKAGMKRADVLFFASALGWGI
ncbi:hypothetical protein [Undibacterium sp. JH2W]